MLHQDGSRHLWLPGLGRSIDLIVTMDDATSESYSMFLVEEEGTWSNFLGLRDVISKRGLFCSHYTDRGSHYFHTPKAGEPVSKTVLSEVGRARALMPWLRDTSAVCAPASCSRGIPMICSSVNRLGFIVRLYPMLEEFWGAQVRSTARIGPLPCRRSAATRWPPMKSPVPVTKIVSMVPPWSVLW